MNKAPKLTENVHLVKVAYVLFAIAATLFSVVATYYEPLGALITPYVGWNGGFLYVFTLFFAVTACFSADPALMNTLISFQKLFVLLGVLDLGMGCYIMFTGSAFNNPYLIYSPWRPVFTICVPALWWHILARHKRQLQSAIITDSETSS